MALLCKHQSHSRSVDLVSLLHCSSSYLPLSHPGAAHRQLVPVQQSGQRHPLLQAGHSARHTLPRIMRRSVVSSRLLQVWIWNFNPERKLSMSRHICGRLYPTEMHAGVLKLIFY